MTASGDGDELPTELVTAVFEEPAQGRRRLPELIGLLEADDDRTRLAAALSTCLIAVEYPDTVPYVVRRLSDRLGQNEVSLELTHALDYLADRYPDTVEGVLDELETEAAEAADRRDLPLPETGNFTRSYYYDATPERGSGGGRIRLPHSDGEDDPRLTYAEGVPDQVGQFETGPDDRPSEAGDADEADDESSSSTDAGQSPGALVRRTTDVSDVAVRSRFDQLHILAAPTRSRYSTDYDALVGTAGDEEAIALRILHLPSDEAGREAFEAAGGEHLGRWAAIADHPHVVSLRDWAVEPRPWLATSFAGESLVDQDRFEPDRALHDALALADAMAYSHRKDTVHGGIDAGNVAYPSDVLGSNDQEPPLLNNVGMLHVYRPHANPVRFLDPRYAAPEYYDRRFGTIDAATDVYQLGAVIYRLYTGKPPVTGSFESVKSAVTGSDIPVPGNAVEGIPPAIDEVVAKAMATEKLHRYETVELLRQELAGLQGDSEL